jgi:hypothetical protein
MGMIMGMIMAVVMMMIVVVVILFHMHVKPHSGHAAASFAAEVKVPAAHAQGAESCFEAISIHSQVEQRTQEHVAAYAAEQIQVEDAHCSSPLARALIWLAA